MSDQKILDNGWGGEILCLELRRVVNVFFKSDLFSSGYPYVISDCRSDFLRGYPSFEWMIVDLSRGRLKRSFLEITTVNIARRPLIFPERPFMSMALLDQNVSSRSPCPIFVLGHFDWTQKTESSTIFESLKGELSMK
jgi:hypothetical protein